MLPRDSFRTRLNRGDRTLGVLFSLPAGALAEMSAVAGMDFVLIDCEHGSVDYSLLEHSILVAERHGADVFVRVGLGEPALVQRCLDMGATGIIFPHIDTVEQARAAVGFARYPPLGNRGFSNYGRVGKYGRIGAAEHVHAEEDTIVIVMIESPAAFDALPGILTVPGVDGIMSGPADLAVSAQADVIDDPRVRKMLAGIHDCTSRADKFELVVVATKQDVVEHFTSGVQMVAINLAPVIANLLDDWRRLTEVEVERKP